MSELEEFQARARKIIKDSGLSYRELSRRAGMYDEFVSTMLSAKSSKNPAFPRIESLIAVAKVLGISVTDFFEVGDVAPAEPQGQQVVDRLRHELGRIMMYRQTTLRDAGLIQQMAEAIDKVEELLQKGEL